MQNILKNAKIARENYAFFAKIETELNEFLFKNGNEFTAIGQKVDLKAICSTLENMCLDCYVDALKLETEYTKHIK